MSKKPLFGSNSLRKTSSHHKSDFDGPRMAKQLRHSTKLKIGDATDDIHVCIMCLRAIMNNKFGFNMVIAHEQAINCIALSLVSLPFLCNAPNIHTYIHSCFFFEGMCVFL